MIQGLGLKKNEPENKRRVTIQYTVCFVFGAGSELAHQKQLKEMKTRH